MLLPNLVLILVGIYFGRLLQKKLWDSRLPSKYVHMQRSWKDIFHFNHATERLVDWGYHTIIKATQKPFQLNYWGRPYLVLPLKYLPEVIYASNARLNGPEAMIDNLFMGYWSKDLFANGYMAQIIRQGLNLGPNLNKATEASIVEAQDAFSESFGDCARSTVTAPFMSVNTISTKILVSLMFGKELGHDKGFLDAINSYIQAQYVLATLIVNLPGQKLQEFLAKPITYLYRQRKQRMIDRVAHLIEKRKLPLRESPSEQSEFDMIGLVINFIDRLPDDSGGYPLRVLCQELIHNVVAGTSGIVITVVQMLYHILSQGAYLEPLRQEADEAIRKFGWTEKMIDSLPLQDSFIREINRFYPMFMINCNRIVKRQPFVFSDGFTLPIGTRFAFPTGPSRFDPQYFDDPDTFDGYRWIKLAEMDKARGESGSKWSASTASVENLTFGLGNHACPGRFVTIRICKIIFTKLITEYCVSWDRAENDLPPRYQQQGCAAPNPFEKVRMQKRASTNTSK